MASSVTDEYGIYIGEIKEKELVKSIDAFLTEYFTANSNYNIYASNKLAKRKNRGGVDDPEHPEKTFVYDYSYDYHNKYFGIYLMVYGNKNKSGEIKYAEDIEWIIMVNRLGYYSVDLKPINARNPLIEDFIQLFWERIAVKHTLLKRK